MVKVFLGAPPSKSVGGCPHAFEEVKSSDGKTLYGWHCPRCHEHRRLRVCAVCTVEFGKDHKPDSTAKLCDKCNEKHRARYGVDQSAKKPHRSNKGGDNR